MNLFENRLGTMYKVYIKLILLLFIFSLSNDFYKLIFLAIVVDIKHEHSLP